MGFEADILTVPEDAGNVFIPVTISQEVPEPITVDILYQNGSAMEQSGINNVYSLTTVFPECKSQLVNFKY